MEHDKTVSVSVLKGGLAWECQLQSMQQDSPQSNLRADGEGFPKPTWEAIFSSRPKTHKRCKQRLKYFNADSSAFLTASGKPSPLRCNSIITLSHTSFCVGASSPHIHTSFYIFQVSLQK